MINDERHDIEINGTGQIAGGVYKSIDINGAATGNGFIDCITLECNGVFSHLSNLKAENIEINGTANISGSIEANDIEVNGTCSIKNSLKADSIEINGSFNIEGIVDAQHIEINGVAKFGSNVNSEVFEVYGGFNVDGLLNADKIYIKMFPNFKKCSAKEIGCSKIAVEVKKFSILASIFKSFSSVFEAESIEGDEIHLENTHAKIVRGKNINIGPGCEIDTIEYSESLNVDSDSIIKKSEKIQ